MASLEETLDMNDPLHRAIEVRLSISGQTWEEILADLRHTLFLAQSEGPYSEFITKPYSSVSGTSIFLVQHDPTMTQERHENAPEQWMKENENGDGSGTGTPSA